MNISEQSVLVTGANRGLGRQLALELIARGAKVYAGARNADSIDYPEATPLQLDITNPESVSAAAEVAKDVTVLINNAGSATGASILTGDMNEIREIYETHLFGTLSMSRTFAPIIEANGGGHIQNILSVLSWLSMGPSPYPSAKAAEWALTNTLRLELADKNIRVSGLHVAFMDTDMTAQITAPKADPADIAKKAIDGIEAGSYEILADNLSMKVQKDLAEGIRTLYPNLY